jgi:hypothetical protein
LTGGRVGRGRQGEGTGRTVAGVPRPALILLLLALTAAVLGAVPTAAADTTAGEEGRGCAPLDDAGLVQQLVGVPVRVTAIDAPLREAMAGRAGTAVLFGAAIDTAAQVRALVADLDAASPEGIPPIVAVDEEGGRVARFGRAGLAVHLPAARTHGRHRQPRRDPGAGGGPGSALADLGVDLDLAPVLDLWTRRRTRSSATGRSPPTRWSRAITARRSPPACAMRASSHRQALPRPRADRDRHPHRRRRRGGQPSSSCGRRTWSPTAGRCRTWTRSCCPTCA